MQNYFIIFSNISKSLFLVLIIHSLEDNLLGFSDLESVSILKRLYLQVAVFI